MKRPSFQFYPSDWLGNSNLRRCSHAEKGAWIDVMCLLNDAEEYGILRWPLKDISMAIGCDISLLKSIASKGVFRGIDSGICEELIYTPRHGRKNGDPITLIPVQTGPIWYSSRMVRDEYVRKHRGETSRFVSESVEQEVAPKPTPKTTPKPTPKPPFGAVSGDGSTSTSTSTCKPTIKNIGGGEEKIDGETGEIVGWPIPETGEVVKLFAGGVS